VVCHQAHSVRGNGSQVAVDKGLGPPKNNARMPLKVALSVNTTKYFQELSLEFRYVKNRIRDFIGLAHLPSDGAWKEGVLRAVFRRHLPPSYTIGTGFVLTENGHSKQTDIIICDDSAPLFFRDGDFIITTADCVRAAIEVKTSIPVDKLRQAVTNLNELSILLRNRPMQYAPFLGIFSYEPSPTSEAEILEILSGRNDQDNFAIKAMSFGDRQFYRFWDVDPNQRANVAYKSWHAYNFKRRTAPGYFVHNLVESIFPNAVGEMWYPPGGKEPDFVAAKERNHSSPVGTLQL
jgi:hypothetical protein